MRSHCYGGRCSPARRAWLRRSEKVRPGMTELDVYLIVQNAAMTSLGEQVIVYGDFASGPRCARDKGGSPTARKSSRAICSCSTFP